MALPISHRQSHSPRLSWRQLIGWSYLRRGSPHLTANCVLSSLGSDHGLGKLGRGFIRHERQQMVETGNHTPSHSSPPVSSSAEYSICKTRRWLKTVAASDAWRMGVAYTQTSPALARQAWIPHRPTTSSYFSIGTRPAICEPGAINSGEFSAGTSSRCTRSVIMRASSSNGGATCCIPPLMVQGP